MIDAIQNVTWVQAKLAEKKLGRCLNITQLPNVNA